MQCLTPIILIIGSLYSFHQFTYSWWVAGCSSETEAEKLWFSAWALAGGVLFLMSLLSWVAYVVALWRRRRVTVLGLTYIGLWVLVLGGTWLWGKFFLMG